MPLVTRKLGDDCRSYTMDKGLAGGAPGAPATYADGPRTVIQDDALSWEIS